MIWGYLANASAITLYLVTILGFFKPGVVNEILGPLSAIYVGVLTVYVGQKEYRRWSGNKLGKHPGELYVLLWTLLLVLLLIAKVFVNPTYHFSNEVLSAYIAVLGIFALTRASKNLSRRTQRR